MSGTDFQRFGQWSSKSKHVQSKIRDGHVVASPEDSIGKGYVNTSFRAHVGLRGVLFVGVPFPRCCCLGGSVEFLFYTVISGLKFL